MLVGCGRATDTTSPALATARRGDFDTLLAHVLEDQVNGADGDGQDDKGDNDCKHEGAQYVVNDGDMLTLPDHLAQRLLALRFICGISAMSISTSLSMGLQSIQAGMQRVNIAGGRIAAQAPDAEVLATNAVEQMSGRHQVGLSAQVVKTADQMLGTLIDLKA